MGLCECVIAGSEVTSLSVLEWSEVTFFSLFFSHVLMYISSMFVLYCCTVWELNC